MKSIFSSTHLLAIGLSFGCFTALATTPSVAEDSKPVNILMIAGGPSHGYGSHEHFAGLKLLEDAIVSSTDAAKVTVVRGWPQNQALLDAADTLVIYCDGQGRHVVNDHRDALAKKMADGCGLVCIHYAVERSPGQGHEDWINWLGGNFEIHYSVNPHWTATFDSLPEHPVTNGVEPFEMQDEWYFNLRFNPSDDVTPILSAVAPESTMRRPDGHHSGNPEARKKVAAGVPQTLAWTFERPDGGRSFGFTGGHNHWNWAHDPVRRLVTNAIRWSAGQDVEPEGSSLGQVRFQQLLSNQDFPKPDDFSRSEIIDEFGLTGVVSDKKSAADKRKPKETPDSEARASDAKPRLLAATPLVTTETSRHRVEMKADVRGVNDLYLVVTDGGNGVQCDWADWIDPTLHGDDGQKSLVDLDWQFATSGFGKAHQNANCVGEPHQVRQVTDQVGETCIGVHANSVVHYRIPDGFDQLTVTAALDLGGTSQNDGKTSSARFLIYADAVPGDLAELERKMSMGQREAVNAVAGLAVGEGLETTLVASEPQLRSLTNLDIDDRGRIWVCDVMNYRRRDGSRPAGDRILILEDTTGDGVADHVKTFYQGRDIDSAMGICVLGNQVIVTASPYVWRFTDEDGDDVPDRKEALFTGTGQPQHDHSGHSFLFGPDGKLYWNFGNTGGQVKDASGNTVIDIHGREVVDNGAPFFGGMPFRCDLDGSHFEVLAHNFRNNWETTVDSFGTLWQSDNDDDGNRGTRINFVMEHGNYGYLDELTGASWRADRVTMEDEIPLQHWHLNDPGVVPNVLQTGAGSPCGMTVYEGRLLPQRFWDQVIHCDPGPNVVRAYRVTADGAGYTATMDPLLTGMTDKWFRPADVCVAPDGSLFVTDWYDPGVGGHRQEDSDRGRLFRIAPPGTGYTVPKFDYSTAAGAVDALRNPNQSVRYRAWTALHAMGGAAEPELLKLYGDPNPRLRARALWLLGKIEGRGQHYVELAIGDDDPDIRIAGIRLSRQLGMTPSATLNALAADPQPSVRREVAVALRFDDSDMMPIVFANLAAGFDGGDRWMLEALGIASDLRADECMNAYLASVGNNWNTPAGRELVWRIRSDKSAQLLTQIIQNHCQTLDDTSRYFRALEYLPAEPRTAALKSLLSSDDDAVVVRSIQRMEGFDYKNDPVAMAALRRHIKRQEGTPRFLDLVKQFQPAGVQDGLYRMLAGSPSDNDAVEALRLLLNSDEGRRRVRANLLTVAADDHASTAVRIAETLGLLGNGRSTNFLVDAAGQADLHYDVRSMAVRSLAKNNLGAERLLSMVEAEKLPGDTHLLAGGLLARSEDTSVRNRAASLLPLPAQANQSPLAPLDELAKMSGDIAKGEKLFRGVATCGNCHVVGGQGKAVGPDLSQIGDKLSREAMFTSILAPSAGISHNYENYIALLDSGQVISGVMVSQTDDKIVLRTAEAIDRTLDVEAIEELVKSEKSIMPENLHHTTDQQGLVDLVEYMMTLKKTR